MKRLLIVLAALVLGVTAFGSFTPVAHAAAARHSFCYLFSVLETRKETVYIYFPGGGGYKAGSYGYVFTVSLWADSCGNYLSEGSVQSNDTGSPPGYAGLQLIGYTSPSGSPSYEFPDVSKSFNGGAGTINMATQIFNVFPYAQADVSFLQALPNGELGGEKDVLTDIHFVG